MRGHRCTERLTHHERPDFLPRILNGPDFATTFYEETLSSIRGTWGVSSISFPYSLLHSPEPLPPFALSPRLGIRIIRAYVSAHLRTHISCPPSIRAVEDVGACAVGSGAASSPLHSACAQSVTRTHARAAMLWGAGCVCGGVVGLYSRRSLTDPGGVVSRHLREELARTTAFPLRRGVRLRQGDATRPRPCRTVFAGRIAWAPRFCVCLIFARACVPSASGTRGARALRSLAVRLTSDFEARGTSASGFEATLPVLSSPLSDDLRGAPSGAATIQRPHGGLYPRSRACTVGLWDPGCAYASFPCRAAVEARGASASVGRSSRGAVGCGVGAVIQRAVSSFACAVGLYRSARALRSLAVRLLRRGVRLRLSDGLRGAPSGVVWRRDSASTRRAIPSRVCTVGLWDTGCACGCSCAPSPCRPFEAMCQNRWRESLAPHLGLRCFSRAYRRLRVSAWGWGCSSCYGYLRYPTLGGCAWSEA
ncbi:hypothetical protein B0H19DRAFT_539886 [Mycena capillaripes]|nr:hypothetical protein B0H19DRAFT_539886 [Mycena capillaripes]